MQSVRDETKRAGAGFELRVMASHGGTISIEAQGAGDDAGLGPDRRRRRRRRRSPSAWGSERALHRHRRHLVRHRADHRRALRDHADARHRPLHAQHAAGQDRLDRRRHRLLRARRTRTPNRPELGPDSAGSRIGVSWPEGGLDTVSVTDLNVVLGRVNPDYFLGGDITLDPERARAEVERQVAEPLGLGSRTRPPA